MSGDLCYAAFGRLAACAKIRWRQLALVFEQFFAQGFHLVEAVVPAAVFEHAGGEAIGRGAVQIIYYLC